ncbi:hypothetical protein VNO77_25803 [Canavalia gladiata]|uniref:Uncharacterized protein n=1 Tax=Canavalia gladiata TaxID=3824 RepID=A0AAN9KS51_CANGL
MTLQTSKDRKETASRDTKLGLLVKADRSNYHECGSSCQRTSVLSLSISLAEISLSASLSREADISRVRVELNPGLPNWLIVQLRISGHDISMTDFYKHRQGITEMKPRVS